ncbi:MAG: GNAT family N-acetyltransferase [Tissierellia bacterium]|nr:GNAT family N-acetyltransferase [Tissierellia bacterium]
MEISKGKLLIRSVTASDAPLLNKWWNDGKVMEHAGFPLGLNQTLEKTEEEIDSWKGRLSQLCIIEIDGQPVGELSYRIRGEGAAYPGWKICEASFQNQGYGPQIIRLLFEFIFTDERINSIEPIDRIVWDTMLDNKRAQYVYEEKIGARKTDIKEKSWQDQLGNWRDLVYYEISREEFFSAGE